MKGVAAGALLAAPFNIIVRRGQAARARADAEQPNIVLFTIDALRADHLACYGYAKATSPNIDRLASEGVQFTNAMSTAPWTFPAFSAIHTSMYPSELGVSVRNVSLSQVYHERVDSLRVTLAEKLRQQGYRTQAFVTNPWLFPEFGFDQGFDGYEVVDRQHAHDYDQVLQQTLVGQLAQRAAPAEASLRALYESLMGPAGQPVWDVRADRVTGRALDWLDRHHQERFFLWVHCIDPHYPFSPPAAYQPSVPDVTPERMAYLASYNEDDIYTGRARLRPADKEAIVGLYDGEIRYVDEYVGRVLARLDELGLRENTFLAFTADHGDEFWEHGGYQHGHSLYNELVHIPLILRGPGLGPQKIESVVRHVDLAPTLTEVAGTPFHADARGSSLLALLNGAAQTDRAAFSEALFLTPEKKAIRQGGLKLITDRLDETSELYDLSSDPRESANLAARETETLSGLKRQLDEWQAASEAKYAALPRSAQTASDQTLIEALRSGGY
jgi:arylsulfatase